MMKLRSFIILASLVIGTFGMADGAALSLGHVEGLSDTDGLETGVPVTFFIRLQGDSANYGGITNGYRIYSPDGAEWTTTVADTTVGAFTLMTWLFNQFLDNIAVTGSGADTVGFGAYSSPPGEGLPASYDNEYLRIQIGPIAAEHHGKTICLDSSFYPPSGVWYWAIPRVDPVYPDWDGPHCYTVHDPDGKPSLVADPVEVVWDLDQVQPANVTVDITDTDASGISFTLTKSQDWLVIDPDVGTTPQTITCSLVVDILVTGQMYYDTIWVTSDDAGNSPFAVPCSVHVTASDIELDGGENRPTSFTLSQNYPNPFNPRTQIRFDLPVKTHVSLTVYNVLGQRVNSLVDEVLSSGQYVVDWDGADQSGSAVSSGIYFYRIEAETFTETRKMVLLK